ncbi:ester cyclase [Mycolicibacterium setense]|uniref:ester cyclase n=1 Tax=Mycolicibacterium setense TaxID=431269 RepID=UPI0003A3E4F2|nr:ester cyclase [Mycolicibacterium setense]OBB21084.1 ester cyclase [Mycolicibacterium setense]
MSSVQLTDNKEVCKRILDAANAHDEELLSQTVDALFDPDVRMTTPLPMQATGVEAIKLVFTTLHRAFPDLHVEVVEMIAEGNAVAVRNTVTGTHKGGEYMGLPATGKSVTYNEIFIFRVEGGRVTETFGVVDVLTQMKQLGVLPS